MTCKSVCSVHAAWYLQRVIHIGRTVPCRRGEGHMGSSQPQTDKRKEQTRQKAKKIQNTKSYTQTQTQTQTQPQCPKKKTKKKEQAKQKKRIRRNRRKIKMKNRTTNNNRNLKRWQSEIGNTETKENYVLRQVTEISSPVPPDGRSEVSCLSRSSIWSHSCGPFDPLSTFQSWNAITWRAN